jgi:phosphoenolpyruvate carboxykinase (GTP)
MTISVIPGADVDTAPTRHARLLEWIREVAELTTPDRIEWCDGSTTATSGGRG